MAGLLDFLNTDEGRMGLGLLAAGGYSPTPMSFGQRIQSAMQGQDAQKRGALQNKLMQSQVDENASQNALRQAQLDSARSKQAALPGLFASPQGAGLLGSPEATGAATGGAGAFDYRAALQAGYSPDEITKLSGLANLGRPEVARTIKGVGPNGLEQEIQYDKFGSPVGAGVNQYRDPNKPFERDATGAVVPNAPYQKYELGKAAASAARTTVSVNTGQRGLDNTLKLRGDFRSEPIYKAHQEVQSAYSQIVQSLDQASPAGDLAGATKFMKILDPGSVVRESELGMAMAASGAMDRLQNYTTNVMNGTKLTPTQRADFKKLATALYDESAKQYNVKRGEYQGIAERNGLNVPDVLGAGATERKPAAMDSLPTANSSNRGRRIRNTETGKEFVSNGMQWKEVK